MTERNADTRFRLFIKQAMVYEEWIDTEHDDPEAQAMRMPPPPEEDPWMIEIYMPWMPEGAQYRRFGNDASMMQNPVERTADTSDEMAREIAEYVTDPKFLKRKVH